MDNFWLYLCIGIILCLLLIIYFLVKINTSKSQIKEQFYIKRNSIYASVAIFNSFSIEEAKAMHPCILTAWRIGRRAHSMGARLEGYYAE